MEKPDSPSAGGRERALQLWASGVGIGGEVARLNAALEDIKSVLSEAMTKEIHNKALVRSLKDAWQTARQAEDLQSELDYCRIQQELEFEAEDDDDDNKIVQSNKVLLSTPGACTHLCNNDVAQAAEDPTNNSALSTECSSLAACQIVPHVASPMTPTSGASPIIFESFGRDNISREINEHIDECRKGVPSAKAPTQGGVWGRDFLDSHTLAKFF